MQQVRDRSLVVKGGAGGRIARQQRRHLVLGPRFAQGVQHLRDVYWVVSGYPGGAVGQDDNLILCARSAQGIQQPRDRLLVVKGGAGGRIAREQDCDLLVRARRPQGVQQPRDPARVVKSGMLDRPLRGGPVGCAAMQGMPFPDEDGCLAGVSPSGGVLANAGCFS
jgi:hypothetical protein